MTEIARRLNLNRSTVSKIVKKFKNTGKITTKKKGGNRKKILCDEHKNALKGYLNEDATLSLNILKQRLFNNFVLNCSLKTIDRAIQGFFYSLKRLTKVPVKRNSPFVISKRFNYAQDFYQIFGENDGNNIIYLDEVRFNLSMKRSRKRSLIVTNASTIVQQLKTRNISVCAVQTKNGIIHHSVETKPFNTTSFNVFLLELIEILRCENMNNVIFVMDNVPFHRSINIRNYIYKQSPHSIFAAILTFSQSN
ncbi:hypothetical protein DMUE_3400 [Dictyocoela muelleri]|nr:hypothetical protein DMUE_3400 [Dictyocoela muelleri]